VAAKSLQPAPARTGRQFCHGKQQRKRRRRSFRQVILELFRECELIDGQFGNLPIAISERAADCALMLILPGASTLRLG
jgi:hypothetical protein